MRSDMEVGVFTVTENTESYSPGIDFTHMTSHEDTRGRTRTVYTQLIDCVTLARAQQTVCVWWPKLFQIFKSHGIVLQIQEIMAEHFLLPNKKVVT